MGMSGFVTCHVSLSRLSLATAKSTYNPKIYRRRKIMKNTIFNAYSEVYSAALMQNVKHPERYLTNPHHTESRFGKLVKFLRRA
jgi:hypothetical protein